MKKNTYQVKTFFTDSASKAILLRVSKNGKTWQDVDKNDFEVKGNTLTLKKNLSELIK